MPWRDDYVEAFWIDSEFGLAGWPEDIPEKPAVESALKTEPHYKPKEPTEAVMVMRDRIGFRYERIVGLGDYLSQREAATLLGVPVMRVNRWVRRNKLASRKRNGYSVVLLRDVLDIARTEGCEIRTKGRLVVLDGDHTERQWVESRRGYYEQCDEEGA